ncbi:hypothetical protein B0J12DRAFT_746740 [Macrophomina phaseolina]|uniref:FAD-binding domain-containing protein n=1 Tax=Macrophomina phaseolina TaxID=35725 RepID=A0ABQ8FUD6_9PEZI|nr:hypothetical protein B0J12DRAFT_746740 [Macrophomina phaseolina]
MTRAERLRVLVVGAGIGGLSAAIVLRQQGHDVEIFEKSRLASEVGAAVHVAPNCTALLNRMGVFPESFGATVNESIIFRDSKTTALFKKAYEHERPQWQAEYFLIHRVDLHTALKDKALSDDGPGLPARLHTSCGITDVDCNSATITLVDGTKVTGDLVVAADGIHSRVRRAVTGRDVPLFTSGKCAYRWLMPTSVLQEDPETRLFAQEPGQVVQVAGDGSNGEYRRIVFYPCSNNTVMNCIAFVPSQEVGPIKKDLSGYNQSANKGKLIGHFDGFSSPVIRMLEKAPEDDVMLWDLLDMEVLPTWVSGKTVLLGDAAHPFLPYMGQGAAQAVEDAAALGACFPTGSAPDEVHQRLLLWEKCRKSRADWVQEVTRIRGRDPSGKDGPPQTPEEFAVALKECLAHNAWNHAINVQAALQEQKVSASL